MLANGSRWLSNKTPSHCAGSQPSGELTSSRTTRTALYGSETAGGTRAPGPGTWLYAALVRLPESFLASWSGEAGHIHAPLLSSNISHRELTCF